MVMFTLKLLAVAKESKKFITNHEKCPLVCTVTKTTIRGKAGSTWISATFFSHFGIRALQFFGT